MSAGTESPNKDFTNWAHAANPEMALTFYRTIFGDEYTEFRLIHTNDRPDKVLSFWGSIEEEKDLTLLAKYNSEGYGVYAVINRAAPEAEKRITAKNRKDKGATQDDDIIGIRAVYIDQDNEAKPGSNLAKIRAAPLAPSGVVCTGLEYKLQAYWLIADMPPAKDEYKRVQKALIAHFDSDPLVTNLSHVMRLPGFINTKPKYDSPLVRLLEAPGHLYTRHEFLKAFGIPLEPPEPPKRDDSRERVTVPSDASHLRKYALAALQKEADTLAAMPADSGRNARLNRAAYVLGGFIPHGLLERHEIEDALMDAARECGLVSDDGERACQTTLESGLSKAPLRDLEKVKKRSQRTGKTTVNGNRADSEPDEEGSESKAKTRPRNSKRVTVDFYTIEHEDQAAETIDTLKRLNSPSFLFAHQAGLARIVRVKGVPQIDQLNVDSFRSMAQERIAFKQWKIAKHTGEWIASDKNLSRDFAAYILSKDNYPFPYLQGIIYNPAYSPSGELLLEPGYSPAGEVYVDLAGFTPRPVPKNPSTGEVQQAKETILENLLVDFPFEGEASSAHALALGLQPYVRLLIDGPTPIIGIDAPQAGTGKGLLAEVMSSAATGRSPKFMTEGRDDDEWRKRITSTLLESPSVVLIDNVTRKVSSGALASVTTSRVWTDRILGKSENTTLPIFASWVMTGNNLATSHEIARRMIWCRLDAKTEQPWRRKDFKHENLANWVNKNRHEIVWSFLVLCQNWIAQGKRYSGQTLGSFEAWSKVIGGILEANDVPGFLSNLDTFYQKADLESREWREFVQIWWDKHKAASGRSTENVTAGTLFALASEKNLLLTVLGDKGERSQRTRLGIAMGQRVDWHVGGFIIRRSDQTANGGVPYFYLELQENHEAPSGEV